MKNLSIFTTIILVTISSNAFSEESKEVMKKQLKGELIVKKSACKEQDEPCLQKELAQKGKKMQKQLKGEIVAKKSPECKLDDEACLEKERIKMEKQLKGNQSENN